MRRLQQWFDLIAGISAAEQQRLERARARHLLRPRPGRRRTATAGLLATAGPRRRLNGVLECPACPMPNISFSTVASRCRSAI